MQRLFALFFLILTLGIPAHADEVSLDYEGITLHASLVTTGDGWQQGPVVLMTHGTLAHYHMEIMDSLQAVLLARGISSLSINLSLGLSDREGMYDCKVPHTHEHTDAVSEIGLWQGWLAGQGVERLILLGHSRGGNQTARYALEHDSERLRGVILVAPPTWSEGKHVESYEKRYGKPLAPVLAMAEDLVARGQGETLMQPVDFIYCEQSAATAAAFVSYYRADPHMDTPSLIRQLTKPVLVFAGSEDTVVAGLAEAMEGIDQPNVRFEMIDGADHFFRDLYAEELGDISKAFIAQALAD